MSATADERPPALAQAEIGAQAWRAAAGHQLRAPADHADLYALAGEAATTLHALDDLISILANGRRLRDRPALYDDTGQLSPAEQLAQAPAEIDAPPRPPSRGSC
jgi:hypothetical protein